MTDAQRQAATPAATKPGSKVTSVKVVPSMTELLESIGLSDYLRSIQEGKHTGAGGRRTIRTRMACMALPA